MSGEYQLSTLFWTVSTIENKARYSGYQVSVGGGLGFGGQGSALVSQVADGAAWQVGASATGKVGMATPIVAGARGSGSSTTQSGIGGGVIEIRDAVAQQDLTGMTVTQTVASLNRDTADTLMILLPA